MSGPQPWSKPASGWADPEPSPGSGGTQDGWRPQLSPSPPQSRRGVIIGGLVGLLVGLLAAAPAGYLVGHSTSNRSVATPSASAPAPSGSLRPFEASQLAVNKAKFPGELVQLAEPWMPWVNACVTSAEVGGPKLGSGERMHVLCHYGVVGVHFVLFNSVAERDAARGLRQRRGTELRDQAPGAAEPTHRTGTSGRGGTYVEYAVRSGNGTGKIVSGVWWNLDEQPTGLYFEALWETGLGESWEPLRDLWQRYS